MKKILNLFMLFLIWHWQVFDTSQSFSRRNERAFVKFLKHSDYCLDVSVKEINGGPRGGTVFVGYLQDDNNRDLFDVYPDQQRIKP